MNKLFSLFASILLCHLGFSQSLIWKANIDTATTFSSPRPVHLNHDSVADIIIGSGLDGIPHRNGIIAIDGLSGNTLWTFPTNDEIFASAQFMDISGDGIEDVFIGGRYAELYAIDGASGQMIWEFFSAPSTQALDSGWFNFYSTQFIEDQNSDGFKDLLISNGGNHSAPDWDTLRDPGMLMILDATNGTILARDTTPDGEETYCSPVIVNQDGTKFVIYGTGGEDDGGSLWKVSLNQLMQNDLSGSIKLMSHPDQGFIAPVSIANLTSDTTLDIICQGYDGTVYAFDGKTDQLLWQTHFNGTESSAAPCIGNFTGDLTPDVFCVLAKGTAPSFFDYYQILIDGSNGQVIWKDSIGALSFSSAGAVDLNLDGRDEAVISINYHTGAKFVHELTAIDFTSDSIYPIYPGESGVNLGSSPLIADLDSNKKLDILYVFRTDSINPIGKNGFQVRRIEFDEITPTGVAWGAYMGTDYNGHYQFQGKQCDSFETGLVISEITCNDSADGVAYVVPKFGKAPYNTIWSNGLMTSNIDNLTPGNYYVRVVDSAGCYSDSSFVLANPHKITFGGFQQVTCPGGTDGKATVSSTGCPCNWSNCKYDWSSGDSTKKPTQLSAGWNTVLITTSYGCKTLDSVFLNTPDPVVDSTTIGHIECSDSTNSMGSVNLHANQGLTSISWNSGDSTNPLTIANPGTYFYHATDSRGCDFADTVKVGPILSIERSGNLLCYGDSSAWISATIYGWENPLFTWSDGQTSDTALALGAGTYFVEVQNKPGCFLKSDSIEILQPDSLTVQLSVLDGDNGDCKGKALLNVVGGTPDYEYFWNDSIGDTLASNLCYGNNTWKIVDSNDCEISGIFIVSNTTNTNDLLFHREQIKLFPTPANSHFLIDISATEWTGKITTTEGKTVRKFENKHVSVSDLEAGIYLVEIESLGKMHVIKLVVAH